MSSEPAYQVKPTPSPPRNHKGNAAAMHAAPRCEAKTRTTGLSCKNPAMANGRCRLHGGATPNGLAAPRFRTGTSTRYPGMKATLAELADRAMADPDILSLTQEVSLLQARLNQLLERVDVEESSKRWKMTKDAFYRMLEAGGRKDEVGYGMALDELKHAFRDGDKDYLVWSDILSTLEHLRKTVSQEQKRRMEMHTLISADQAVGMFAELMYEIREQVSDPKALNAIYKRAQEIVSKKAR
jgi:hypothetical protein